jgi:hypothetical protein
MFLKLIALSTQRSEMAYSVKSDKIYRDFDNQMEAIKNVLLENIGSANASLRNDLARVNSKIGQFEGDIRKLPKTSRNTSRLFESTNSVMISTILSCKNGAGRNRKAANLSDIHFIDPPKTPVQGLSGLTPASITSWRCFWEYSFRCCSFLLFSF